MDEFGDDTARNYFRNKHVVNQSLQFEGWKDGSEKRDHTQPVSVHILEDGQPSGLKEKEPRSIIYNREPNSMHSAVIGKENKDTTNVKNLTQNSNDALENASKAEREQADNTNNQ